MHSQRLSARSASQSHLSTYASINTVSTCVTVSETSSNLPALCPAPDYVPPALAELRGTLEHDGLLRTAASAPHTLLRPHAARHPPAAVHEGEDEASTGASSASAAAVDAEAGAAEEALGSDSGSGPWQNPAWRAVCAAGAAAEWPLLLARRASIPMLAPECYDRRWLGAALAGGPVFAAWYLRVPPVGYAAAAGIGLAMAAAACASLFAGLGAEDRVRVSAAPPAWRCGTPWPLGSAAVAACGFVLAAMWVDVVASELVGLLQFFGLLSGIDHAVLGLTVLAWGNSVGDLSTNLAMARRGLANMAMTACYAGPLFNLLVGLGLGFLRALGRGSAPATTALSPGAAVSAGFAAAMCLMVLVVGVLGRGRLPARFGWALLGLYATFLGASVLRLLLMP